MKKTLPFRCISLLELSPGQNGTLTLGLVFTPFLQKFFFQFFVYKASFGNIILR